MKCPVCKTECGTEHVCPECGFTELDPVFINEEEAEIWFKETVIPYKTKYNETVILPPIDWVELFSKNPKADILFNVTIPASCKKWSESESLCTNRFEDNNETTGIWDRHIIDAVGHIAIISSSELITKHFIEETEKALSISNTTHHLRLDRSVKEGDLTAKLTNMYDGDLLLVELRQGVNGKIMEMLYEALDCFSLNITLGKGPSANELHLELPTFTALFTFNSADDIPEELLSKMDAVIGLDYTEDELTNFKIREDAFKNGVQISKATLILLKEKAKETGYRTLIKYVSDYLYLHPEIEQPLDEYAMRKMLEVFD